MSGLVFVVWVMDTAANQAAITWNQASVWLPKGEGIVRTTFVIGSAQVQLMPRYNK